MASIFSCLKSLARQLAPRNSHLRKSQLSVSRFAETETLEDRRMLTVFLSPQEQLLIELVNRARQDPQVEAARQGISVQQTGFRAPLAPNQFLVNAAGAYSQRMLNENFFDHVAPDGSTPLQRVIQAGYNPQIVGENIAWIGTTGSFDINQYTVDLHRNLYLSPGHRVGMLDARMKEIGTGLRVGPFTDPRDGRTYNSLMGTELFGTRNANYFITGVTFSDGIVDDSFYTIGEALANVLVTAQNQTTGQIFQDFTGPSGGYSLEVPNGVYTVTFSGGVIPTPDVRPNIVVSGANRKVDFDQSNQKANVLPQNIIVTAADAGGGPHVRVLDAQTGLEWLQFFPYGGGFRGGVRTATGDLNGDNVQDIITAPGNGGGSHIIAYDGRDGRMIANFFAYDPLFRGGAFVAAADVTGDGRAEIITAPGAGGGPHIKIFDLSTGTMIREFMAYNPALMTGVHLATGNVDGVGGAEIITAPGMGGGPHIRVFSPQTGRQIDHPAGSFFAYDGNFRGGVWVASADLNFDGRAEIVTGPGIGGGPHVRVFSGANGAEINGFLAYGGGFTGGVRVATSDVDNNGSPDILTAPGPSGGPHVRAFHGTVPFAIGAGASSFLAFSSNFFGGVHIAGGRNQTFSLIQTADTQPALFGDVKSQVATPEQPQESELRFVEAGETLNQSSVEKTPETSPQLSETEEPFLSQLPSLDKFFAEGDWELLLTEEKLLSDRRSWHFRSF